MVLVLKVSERRLTQLLSLLQLLLLVMLNLSPVSVYYEQTMQTWEQGRFISFNGLIKRIGWLWPYAAMAYLLQRLSASDRQAQ
jgi:hypothetical protein